MLDQPSMLQPSIEKVICKDKNKNHKKKLNKKKYKSFIKIQARDTSNENKWQRPVQQQTTNDNEWQRVVHWITMWGTRRGVQRMIKN